MTSLLSGSNRWILDPVMLKYRLSPDFFPLVFFMNATTFIVLPLKLQTMFSFGGMVWIAALTLQHGTKLFTLDGYFKKVRGLFLI